MPKIAGDPTPAEQANHVATLAPLLNAHQRALFEGLQARMDTPNGRGWLRLIEHLEKAALDPVVVESRGAGSFAALVLMLAQDSVTAESAEEAVRPLGPLLPEGEHGAKFVGRKRGAVGAVRRWVRKHLARHPDATIASIWEELKRKPPKGWQVFENRLGQYVETEDGSPATRARLANILSEERKLQGSKLTG